MERIEELKLKSREYRSLRRICRACEAVTIAALVVMCVHSNSDSIFSIIVLMALILAIPECFLAIRRSEIRMTIRDEKLFLEKDLEMFSWMKVHYEESYKNLISIGSENCISKECKEMLQKEEMGTGWLSTKLKEFSSKCDELKKGIEQLESIKGQVSY